MGAVVTGATGFIGGRLIRALDRPVVLSRDPGRAGSSLGSRAQVFGWDPEAGPPPPESLRGVDVVFHLAGEPVVGGRWTSNRKRKIRDSRVLGTRNLVAALEKSSERPGVLVCASAVGFYGNRGDEVLEESSAPGADFLAEVCQAWETEAARARSLGIRVVSCRIGVVLHRSGGALAQMLPPFQLGLGGRLGSGRQWMPWIHLDDLVGLFLHAAKTAGINGPMNAVGPAPVTNAEFTRVLGSVLRRPTIFPMPPFMLKVVFGEAASILLGSQRAVPKVAEATGYSFRYKKIEAALQAAMKD